VEGARPHAVIFDMDGLMLQSEEIWSDVDRLVLARYGLTYDPSLKPLFMGCEKLESARRFREVYGIADTPQTLARLRSELAQAFYRTRVRLMPGLEPLVAELQSRGKLLAVATSAETAIVETVRARFPVFRAFDTVVCADEVERGKPAPDLFLEAARRLRVSPDASLVLEDSPNGVEAALAAGMKIIAVPNPAVPRETMKHATLVVDKLTDISAEAITRLYEAG
jgi:pseudouridine 5'-phosphatase